MMMDVDQAAKAMRDEEMLAEIEDFLARFSQLIEGYGSMGSGGRPGRASMAGVGPSCPAPNVPSAKIRIAGLSKSFMTQRNI
jgi:hypothetical protein